MLAVATAAPSNMMRDSSDSNEPPKIDGVTAASAEARLSFCAGLIAFFFCLRGVLMA